MGMVMPRHAELTEDVTGRIEDFVVTLLLPLFFAYTGPAHEHRVCSTGPSCGCSPWS